MDRLFLYGNHIPAMRYARVRLARAMHESTRPTQTSFNNDTKGPRQRAKPCEQTSSVYRSSQSAPVNHIAMIFVDCCCGHREDNRKNELLTSLPPDDDETTTSSTKEEDEGCDSTTTCSLSVPTSPLTPSRSTGDTSRSPATVDIDESTDNFTTTTKPATQQSPNESFVDALDEKSLKDTALLTTNVEPIVGTGEIVYANNDTVSLSTSKDITTRSFDDDEHDVPTTATVTGNDALVVTSEKDSTREIDQAASNGSLIEEQDGLCMIDDEDINDLTPCSHGAPDLTSPDNNPDDILIRQEAIEELLACLQATLSQGVSFSQTLVTFLRQPSVEPIVDNQLLSIVRAMAIEQLLSTHTSASPPTSTQSLATTNRHPGQQQRRRRPWSNRNLSTSTTLDPTDPSTAKLLVTIAKALEACLEVGCPEFCRVITSSHQTNKKQRQPAPIWYRQWNYEMMDICSNRDVVLYLHESPSTCQCLQDHADFVRKSLPEIKWCHYCGKKELQAKLMVCAGCRMFRYCSKTCQIKDWKKHETFCRSVSSSAASWNTSS